MSSSPSHRIVRSQARYLKIREQELLSTRTTQLCLIGCGANEMHRREYIVSIKSHAIPKASSFTGGSAPIEGTTGFINRGVSVGIRSKIGRLGSGKLCEQK